MNPSQHIKELQDSALDKCVVECELQVKIDRLIEDIGSAVFGIINHYEMVDDNVKISMPKYLMNLLELNMKSKVKNWVKPERGYSNFIFGVKIVENYQNNIVVFNENDYSFIKNIEL